jgi:hypothetical protein
MTYIKPELVKLPNPLNAIRFQQSKINGSVTDNNMDQSGYPAKLTATAYEADE